MDIKEKAKKLCTCHHKCKDTTDCVVEDDAREHLPFVLTNEDKVSVKGKCIGEMINIIKTSKGYPSNSDCRKCLFEKDSLYKEVAEILYNAGYRKYPCCIGDTVYCIWQYSDFVKIDPPFILEDKVIGFVIDEGIIKPIPRHHHQYPDWYTLRDIKFTREEAEQALAKMKGGE